MFSESATNGEIHVQIFDILLRKGSWGVDLVREAPTPQSGTAPPCKFVVIKLFVQRLYFYVHY